MNYIIWYTVGIHDIFVHKSGSRKPAFLQLLERSMCFENCYIRVLMTKYIIYYSISHCNGIHKRVITS